MPRSSRPSQHRIEKNRKESKPALLRDRLLQRVRPTFSVADKSPFVEFGDSFERARNAFPSFRLGLAKRMSIVRLQLPLDEFPEMPSDFDAALFTLAACALCEIRNNHVLPSDIVDSLIEKFFVRQSSTTEFPRYNPRAILFTHIVLKANLVVFLNREDFVR
jgi:hypothetical protein